MNPGTRECPVCGVFRRGPRGHMCDPCNTSYDRHTATDDGTLMSALLWAAARARRFEKARAKKIDIVDDDSY